MTFALIRLTENERSEAWNFGWPFVGGRGRTWYDIFDRQVNLETAMSKSIEHFKGEWRNSDSSNFSWNSFKLTGPNEKDGLKVGAIITPKVNHIRKWSLDRWPRFVMNLFKPFGLIIKNPRMSEDLVACAGQYAGSWEKINDSLFF